MDLPYNGEGGKHRSKKLLFNITEIYIYVLPIVQRMLCKFSLSLIKAILYHDVLNNQNAQGIGGCHQQDFLFTWKLAKKSFLSRTSWFLNKYCMLNSSESFRLQQTFINHLKYTWHCSTCQEYTMREIWIFRPICGHNSDFLEWFKMTICHGLNCLCPHTPPPNSPVEALISNVTIFGDRAFRR